MPPGSRLKALGSRQVPRAYSLQPTAVLVISLLLMSGCAAWPHQWGTHPCCIDTKPHIRRQPIGWHLFDVTVLSQVQRAFQVVRIGRKLVGVPVRSLNLKDGEVTASAFLTDRDPAQLSPEEVRWGPTRPEDLAQPPFTITKPKTEGKTPGFFVTDARGLRYLLKLDPVKAPELLSGAEVVTSKLLYALGYRVPSYEIVYFEPKDLRIGPRVVAKSPHGQPHPFTDEELQTFLEPRLRDGRVRVAASKILEGEILGPAPFKRFRDCAEVRALKVAYAWVNDIDTKDHNSLLVWDGKETVGYLIDFGTSLGADAGLAAPKHPCEGWRYAVDFKEMSLSLLTLGRHRLGCDPEEHAVDSQVGLFTSRIEPDEWKPYAPNLAFEEMNRDDARWIARRLARLSRAHIDAAVSAGQYSQPEDAAYLADTLDQRRLAIIRHYLRGEQL